MITTKMKLRKNQCSLITNVNSLVQLAIQVKNRIMKHVNVSVRIIVFAKKIIIGIVAHIIVEKVIN